VIPAGPARPPPPRIGGLRDDLEISSAAALGTGQPTWVIYDPVQHRHVQIDSETKQLLSIWSAGITVADLSAAAKAKLGLDIADEQVMRLDSFLRQNRFIDDTKPGAWRELASESGKARHSVAEQLLHNYLFFRVPLFRPQRALEAVLPTIAFLFWRATFLVFASIGLIGFYLVSRQWDAFLSTFHQFLTWEGGIAFALALIVVKALHELGHAVTAVRFGCRIPTIGIAFMLMTPLFYTDVSDAWRLPSRRQRLLIDAAGIIVEIWIACVATLLWAFLPDGTVRGVAFVLATAGWVMSLGLNLNPFMRFDGYYILCDLLGIENLQSRAFAFGRWKVRQTLFAPRLAPPEVMSKTWQRGLIGYAIAIWLYRLVVFTGIAVMVYAYFFKVLGLILFAVEIWYFIISPVTHEIGEWFRMKRQDISRSRARATLAVAGVLLLALIVPWSGAVTLPAVYEASDVVPVFPQRPALVKSIAVINGQTVGAGDILIETRSPDVEQELLTTEIKISVTKLRLARVGSDEADRSERLVLLKELDAQQSKRDGLLAEQRALIIRSPIAGQVLELDPELHAGRWLGRGDRLALVGARQRHVLKGYLDESSLARVVVGASGHFIPDDPLQARIPVHLQSIAQAGATAIEIPALASVYGGRIPVEADQQQRLIPLAAHYLADLTPGGAVASQGQVIRGVVHLAGQPESLMIRAWRQIARVLVRESGF
jgi:putative peptide zinc metalloprotease protein